MLCLWSYADTMQFEWDEQKNLANIRKHGIDFMSKLSATDWARIDAITDETIDTSDIPPLSDAFFARARLKTPRPPKVEVALSVDSDVLDWFKAQGENWEQRANAALRIYAEAHLTSSASHHAA